jgi:hypothetical protein
MIYLKLRNIFLMVITLFPGLRFFYSFSGASWQFGPLFLSKNLCVCHQKVLPGGSECHAGRKYQWRARRACVAEGEV